MCISLATIGMNFNYNCLHHIKIKLFGTVQSLIFFFIVSKFLFYILDLRFWAHEIIHFIIYYCIPKYRKNEFEDTFAVEKCLNF